MSRVLVLFLLAGWFGGAAPLRAELPAQSRFDAAEAAYEKLDYAPAAAAFATFLPPDPAAALRSSQVLIAARYADCLLHVGRVGEAKVWIEGALRASPPAGAADAASLFIIRGEIDRARYDYAAALEDYDHADQLRGAAPLDYDRLQTAIDFAYAGATLDPARTLAKLQKVAAEPEYARLAQRGTKALVEDLEARAAVNAGDVRTASELSDRAVSTSGGLTVEHVTALQVQVRSDAAIVAYLRRDFERTREYMTYTGAGHLRNMAWILEHGGALPVCAEGDGDVRPTDTVIVAFTIDDDGRVAGALPIYASRPGPLGEIFAKDVSTWQWNPELIKKIEPFWRLNLQLQLSCVERPSPRATDSALRTVVDAWLRQHALLTGAEEAYAEKRGDLKIPIADPRLEAPGGAVLAAAYAAPPGSEERHQALLSQLDALHAPKAAYALLIVRAAETGGRRWGGVLSRSVADDVVRRLPEFQSRFPEDRAGYYLILKAALDYEEAKAFDAAQPLLAQVIAAPVDALPEGDEIRKIALLHRAIGLQRGGDAAGAQRLLERSGLTGQQCSMIDTHPVAQYRGMDSNAYPIEANRWSFEGTVQESFDIDRDGRAVRPRTVVAYPPFLFNAASEEGVKGFRYVPPLLGGAPVGCDSAAVTIWYKRATY